MLIDCFLSSLTKSKTKHQENLAVMVKLGKKKTPALEKTDIGKILNHYNIVKEKNVYCCKINKEKTKYIRKEINVPSHSSETTSV